MYSTWWPEMSDVNSVFTCVSYAEARLSYRLDVCPSVRLSVTRWYCINMAEHIVMLSSPHDRPFILFLCISRSSRNSDGVTPCGGAKQRWGVKMSQFSTNTRHRYIAISHKWLMIDMQRGVLQALNSLSIHVTFTAIVPGAYPEEAKMCLWLSWRSQMPAGCTRKSAVGNDIPAWFSWGSQIICRRLIAETDACSVGSVLVAYFNLTLLPKLIIFGTNQRELT